MSSKVTVTITGDVGAARTLIEGQITEYKQFMESYSVGVDAQGDLIQDVDRKKQELSQLIKDLEEDLEALTPSAWENISSF